MHPASFKIQAQKAKRSYDKTGNRQDYIADVAYLAIVLCAGELGRNNPKLKHLETAAFSCQHGIKSLARMACAAISCPVESDHDHDDFARHFWANARYYVDRDLQSVGESIQNVLKHF